MEAAGVEVIDFGMGDPASGPILASSARSSTPCRSWAASARARAPRAARGDCALGRAAVQRSPGPGHRDRPDSGKQGGDLRPRATRRRSRRREVRRRVHRARVPGLRAGSARRRRRAAAVAAPGAERLPAGPGGRRLGADGAPVAQLPEQPDRRGRFAGLPRAGRRARPPPRCRPRLRRGVHGGLVRRGSGVRAPARRPRERPRLQHPEQALEHDRLSLGLRRRRPGARGGDEVVSAVGRHSAAGVRAAGVDRRLGRRGARRADAGPLP